MFKPRISEKPGVYSPVTGQAVVVQTTCKFGRDRGGMPVPCFTSTNCFFLYQVSMITILMILQENTKTIQLAGSNFLIRNYLDALRVTSWL